jgi:hypothetical protein
LMGALLAPHYRSQDLKLRALGQIHDAIAHFIDGLGDDRPIALRTVGYPGPAKQQPQIVVDLRHRAHGGARIVGGGFLVDGNRRTQAFDRVHFRLVQLAQKLAGIGTEGFHIAALALRKNGVVSKAKEDLPEPEMPVKTIS